VDYTWLVPDKGDGDETGAANAKVFVRPSFADYARVELQRMRKPGARRLQFGARMLVPAGQHYHIFEAEIRNRNGMKRTLYCGDEPQVEIAKAVMTPSQSEALDRIRKQRHYSGSYINALPDIGKEGFQIPEELGLDGPTQDPDIDAWAEHPIRIHAWMDCYDEDVKHICFQDLCHADEEQEVRATLQEKYQLYHECYALFSGRSQWPLVRQVDMYSFFEEADVLDGPRFGLPSAPSSPAKATHQADQESAQGEPAWPRLKLQDVQQMLIQTVSRRQQEDVAARGNGSAVSKRAAEVAQRSREGAPLTRPQFIEILLRSALTLRERQHSPAVAFRRFADELIAKRILQPPLSPFPRGLTMRVGEVSDMLLARRKTLREAWQLYGTSEVAFQRLAQLVKLCDRNFTAKHVASVYALVKRPNPELKIGQGRKGHGLRYQEFCEAVARFALVWKISSGNIDGGQSTSPREAAASEAVLQPQVGEPVNEKAIAARLDTFLRRLDERLRPSVPIR